METSTAVRPTPAQEAWAAMREFMMFQRTTMMTTAGDLDLSPPQVFALYALGSDEPAPMSALAGILKCDASNVTGIVDRLEDRGLVQRRPAPHDRRVKHLVLTDRGRETRREIAARFERPPAGFEALTAAEARQLRDLMKKVVAGMPRGGRDR